MKKTVVLFEKGKTARVFVNPESLSKLQEKGAILVNPSIPKGVPPHLWRLVNGRIKSVSTIKKVFIEKKLEKPKFGLFKPFVLIVLGALVTLQVFKYQDVLKAFFKLN